MPQLTLKIVLNLGFFNQTDAIWLPLSMFLDAYLIVMLPAFKHCYDNLIGLF